MTHLEEERLNELWNLLQETWPSTKIEEWCERCETQWQTPDQSQPCGEWKASEDEPSFQEKQQMISDALLRWIASMCPGGETTVVGTAEKEFVSQQSEPIGLRLLLRTSKNFMRCILLSMFASTATNSLQEGMAPWRVYQLLRQYLSWVQEYYVSDPALAQHASQLLFYASYNPVSGSNEGLIKSYDQLLEEDQIMSQLLDCLLRSLEDVALALSIVRNVHNIIVSFPRGMEYTLAAKTSLEDRPPEWPEHTAATFSSVLPYLALRVLDADPPFPGNDKRAELVMEILRAAYVLRLGKQIEVDFQGLFAKLIAKLLRLEVTTPQCEECRREAIPPLMDATAEAVGQFLLSQDVLLPLWAILEHQVTQVVEQTLVQDSAAAAITPILVVLHNVATHHAGIRQQLKSHIFPDEDDQDSFQDKKRREIEQHGKCRNMKPLDAPVGSLRYKLMQLMTWPQSHIKRFTGELLWSLCEGDAQEFIARVGMGNAVVILGARGLVRLPAQISL
jgi:hypothetical protein